MKLRLAAAGLALSAAAFAVVIIFVTGDRDPIGPHRARRVPDGAILLPLDRDAQPIVDRNPPGSVFVLQTGVHRSQQIVPKEGDTIIGEPGAILSGARILTSFVAQDGRFVATHQPPRSGMQRHGICLPDYPRCDLPEDLYVDGKPLRAVAKRDQVRPGTWYYDLDASEIWINDDPRGHTIELSETPVAIGGSASNVSVRDLTIERYASVDQAGAVNHRSGSNWLVTHTEVAWNHGYGLALGNGDQAIANDVHHNGELGIGGGSTQGQTISGNAIAFNGWNGTDCEWECGGAKWGAARDLVVSGNWVHDNGGPGIWTDEGSANVTIETNVIANNRLAGISHEISFKAVIRDNSLCSNGADTYHWGWQSQIQLQNARDTEVFGNRLYLDPSRGGNGITIIDQDRGSEHKTHGIEVHDNTIWLPVGQGVGSGWFAEGPSADLNVYGSRFDRNSYKVAASLQADKLFWAAGAAVDFQNWQASGEDAAGSLVTQSDPANQHCPSW